MRISYLIGFCLLAGCCPRTEVATTPIAQKAPPLKVEEVKGRIQGSVQEQLKILTSLKNCVEGASNPSKAKMCLSERENLIKHLNEKARLIAMNSDCILKAKNREEFHKCALQAQQPQTTK